MNLRLILTISQFLLPSLASTICNGGECYPEIFEPTNEWQIVKEGQHIPPGLHVRLNMELNQREAKILDGSEENNAVAVVDTEKEEEEQEAVKAKIKEALEKYKNQKKEYKRSTVNEGELNDFGSAVKEIASFNTDLGRVERALETLVDLAHDREFGVRLTQDSAVFDKIHQIALEVDDSRVKEMCYNVLAASLRNNPEAVTNVLKNQPSLFVDTLLGVLQETETSDILQKRIVGVFQGLVSDASFAQQRVGDLISVFPDLGKQAKDRVAVILEDLNLAVTGETSDKTISEYIQQSLSESKTASESQLKLYFRALASLHETGVLKPTKQFVAWLAEEVEKRKRGSDAESTFNKFMLEARHTIFGNPNAARKADELWAG